MKKKYEYGQKLLETVNGAKKEKIRKRVILMRHSVREHDPLKGEIHDSLNEKGRSLARIFGEKLYPKCSARIFFSPIGRCAETGDLLGKGYQETGGHIIESEKNWQLGAFYVRDLDSILDLLYQTGSSITLIRTWIEGSIPVEWMDAPTEVIRIMVKWLEEIFEVLKEEQMAICVTHDLNIYFLRTLLLDLNLEHQGRVNYLDGIFFYDRMGEIYASTDHSPPKRLKWQAVHEVA